MTAAIDERRASLPSRWRVLVVENAPKQRDDHVQNLIGWGYDVYVAEVPADAEDAFDALEADAIHKGRMHDCHFAVIDQRLQSDVNQQDSSGLGLAEELEGIQCIVLSGYPPVLPEHNRDSVWLRVGKQEGPERLKRALDTLVENKVKMSSNTCLE